MDSFTAQRVDYYGMTAWPTICGDGVADIWPTSELPVAYNALHSISSPLDIELEENGVGDFTAHIHAEQAVSGARFVMAAVLDESVAAHGGGQSHLPYHCKVFMTAITGDAFSIAAGADADIRKTFTVNPAWDYSKMGVVSWVQRPGGTNPVPPPSLTMPIRNEVLQAAYIHAMAAGVPEADRGQRVAFLPPSPNPFVGKSGLAFSLTGPNHVVLGIYDVAGRRVATLVDAPLAEGAHEVEWDGREQGGVPCAAGVYFARLTCGGAGTACQKIVKLR